MLLSLICTTFEKRRRGWTPGRLEYARGVRKASAGNTQFKIPAEAVRTPLAYSNLPEVQPRRRFFPKMTNKGEGKGLGHSSLKKYIHPPARDAGRIPHKKKAKFKGEPLNCRHLGPRNIQDFSL